LDKKKKKLQTACKSKIKKEAQKEGAISGEKKGKSPQ